MSDRIVVLEMETHTWPKLSSTHRESDSVTLFMDGESGTWRLFVNQRDNADFSLAKLQEFRDRLSAVLEDIARDPEEFNAEVRKLWVNS